MGNALWPLSKSPAPQILTRIIVEMTRKSKKNIRYHGGSTGLILHKIEFLMRYECFLLSRDMTALLLIYLHSTGSDYLEVEFAGGYVILDFIDKSAVAKARP